MEKIRIAIIEDDQELRDALSIMIKRYDGFDCIAVYGDGETALSSLPTKNVDVVLTDIHLPGISGIEVVKELKYQHQSIQFLMLTSLEDTEVVFNALKAGATGYLVKTTQPSKLFDAIVDIHQGGSPMSSQIARKIVSSFSHQPVHSNMAKLSEREQEIIQYLSQGLRYKEIADRLFISTETVRTHIRNIYEKLQVNSRTEALNQVYPK